MLLPSMEDSNGQINLDAVMDPEEEVDHKVYDGEDMAEEEANEDMETGIYREEGLIRDDQHRRYTNLAEPYGEQDMWANSANAVQEQIEEDKQQAESLTGAEKEEALAHIAFMQAGSFLQMGASSDPYNVGNTDGSINLDDVVDPENEVDHQVYPGENMGEERSIEDQEEGGLNMDERLNLEAQTVHLAERSVMHQKDDEHDMWAADGDYEEPDDQPRNGFFLQMAKDA